MECITGAATSALRGTTRVVVGGSRGLGAGLDHGGDPSRCSGPLRYGYHEGSGVAAAGGVAAVRSPPASALHGTRPQICPRMAGLIALAVRRCQPAAIILSQLSAGILSIRVRRLGRRAARRTGARTPSVAESYHAREGLRLPCAPSLRRRRDPEGRVSSPSGPASMRTASPSPSSPASTVDEPLLHDVEQRGEAVLLWCRPATSMQDGRRN